MDAIRTAALTKSFGDLAAVDGLTLRVAEGEIFGLVGPDGAGKTTTMRLLTAIMSPTSGEAWVAGRHAVREAEAVHGEIGYMSQRFGLYPDLTVMENLDFYADIYGVPRRGRGERIERLLAFSNLTPFKRRLAGNLSGGMKQKLGLACTLIHTPKVLFLDEPTNGVDPISRRQFWDLIYDLSGKGTTVFVTTHYMDEAEYCDRIGLIYRGELVAMGTPEALKTELMREEVLEVLCERPQEAMGEVEKVVGVHEVALFGRGLHVVAQDGEVAAAAVRDLLDTRGYRVARVERIDPSLEDVFVSLIEARDRAERPQQEVRR